MKQNGVSNKLYNADEITIFCVRGLHGVLSVKLSRNSRSQRWQPPEYWKRHQNPVLDNCSHFNMPSFFVLIYLAIFWPYIKNFMEHYVSKLFVAVRGTFALYSMNAGITVSCWNYWWWEYLPCIFSFYYEANIYIQPFHCMG